MSKYLLATIAWATVVYHIAAFVGILTLINFHQPVYLIVASFWAVTYLITLWKSIDFFAEKAVKKFHIQTEEKEDDSNA